MKKVKKTKIVIVRTKEKCTLKTDGKTQSADVCDAILSALCVAGKAVIRDGLVDTKAFREIAINTLRKEFKEPESEGKEDEATEKVEA